MSSPDDIDRIIFGEDKPPPSSTVVSAQGDEIDSIIFGPPTPEGPAWYERAGSAVKDFAGKAKDRYLEPALETAKEMGGEAKRGLVEAAGPALELAPGAIVGGVLGGIPGAAAGSAADFAISGGIGATKGAIWGSPEESVSARARRGILDFSPSAALLNKMTGGERPPTLPDSWQATAGEPDVERLGGGPVRGKEPSEETKRMLLSPRLGEEDRIQGGALTREEMDARRQEMYDSPITDIVAGGLVTGGMSAGTAALRGVGRAAKRQVPSAIRNLTPEDVAATTTGREAGFPASVRQREQTAAAIERQMDELQDLAKTQRVENIDAILAELDDARVAAAERERGKVANRIAVKKQGIRQAQIEGEGGYAMEGMADLEGIPDQPGPGPRATPPVVRKTSGGLEGMMNEADIEVPRETPPPISTKKPGVVEPEPQPRPVSTEPIAPTVAEPVAVPVEQPVPRTQTAEPTVPRETPPPRPVSQSVVSGELQPEAKWADALLDEETGGVPKTALEKLGQKWSGFWDPFSTLPEGEKFMGLRNKARGFEAKSEAFIESIFKKMDRHSSERKKQLFEYLDGRLTLNDIDPEIRPFANSIRRTNNMVGRMLVRAVVVSEEVYQKNKNAYVHHMYLKHVLGDDFPTVRGPLDLSVGKKRTLVATPEGLKKLNAKRAKAQESPLTMDEYKALILERQRAIGFIEDASIAESVGLTKALRDIGQTNYLNEVIKNKNWVWPDTVVKFEGRNIGMGELAEELNLQRKIVKTAPNVPEAQARLKTLEDLMDKAEDAASLAPDDFKKMPTSSSFGPLAGSFVRKEIYADLVPMDAGIQNLKDFSTTLYYLSKANKKAMSVYKVAHTAANVPTVARNAVSNIVQLNMSGIPLWEVPVYMWKAARSMHVGDKLYTLAKRNGLFFSNFSKGELRNGIEIVKTMQGGSWNKMLRGALKLTDAYGKVDDFYKMAKFIEQMEKKVGVEKAIIEANKWGMDYSVAHPLVKSARQNIMPFASYQYKIYPLIAESLAKNPWTIMKYMFVPNIAYGVARKTLDLTDDEWKRLNRELPEFIEQNRTYAILPIRSPEGRAQWVNLEYYLPWQQPLALYRDIKEGKWGDVVGKDLGIQHPVLDMYAIGKMMRGDDPPTDPFSKRPIYNRLDTPTEKTLAVAEWLYNQYTPSMVQRHGVAGKVVRAYQNIQDPTKGLDRAGTVMTPGIAAASLVGFNVIAPAPEAAFKEREAKMYRLEKDRVEALKKPNLSQEKRQQIWDEYRARKKELLTEED